MTIYTEGLKYEIKVDLKQSSQPSPCAPECSLQSARNLQAHAEPSGNFRRDINVIITPVEAEMGEDRQFRILIRLLSRPPLDATLDGEPET